jgi:hypothetical protein
VNREDREGRNNSQRKQKARRQREQREQKKQEEQRAEMKRTTFWMMGPSMWYRFTSVASASPSSVV